MTITDYEKATIDEIKDEMAENYRIEKIDSIEKDRVNEFYEARTAAFKILEDQYNADKETLATEWQEYEDNDYTILA